MLCNQSFRPSFLPSSYQHPGKITFRSSVQTFAPSNLNTWTTSFSKTSPWVLKSFYRQNVALDFQPEAAKIVYLFFPQLNTTY